MLNIWGTWSEEHSTLDLGVMSSSPTLDVDVILKNVCVCVYKVFEKRDVCPTTQIGYSDKIYLC